MGGEGQEPGQADSQPLLEVQEGEEKARESADGYAERSSAVCLSSLDLLQS